MMKRTYIQALLAAVTMMVLSGCGAKASGNVQMIIPPHQMNWAANTDVSLIPSGNSIRIQSDSTDDAILAITEEGSHEVTFVNIPKENGTSVNVVSGQPYILSISSKNMADEYRFVDVEVEGAQVKQNAVVSLRKIISEKKTDISGYSEEELDGAWGKSTYVEKRDDRQYRYYAIDGYIVISEMKDGVLESLTVQEPVTADFTDNPIDFSGTLVLVEAADGRGYMPFEFYNWNNGALIVSDCSRFYLDLNNELDLITETGSTDDIDEMKDYIEQKLGMAFSMKANMTNQMDVVIPKDMLERAVEVLNSDSTFCFRDSSFSQNYVLRGRIFDSDSIIILNRD